MTTEITSITQIADYAQLKTRSREVKRAEKREAVVKAAESLTNAEQNSAQSSFIQSKKAAIEKTPTVDYERPLPPSLAALKAFVETLSGKELELAYDIMNYAYFGHAVDASRDSHVLAENSDLVNIDGNVYHADEMLTVTETVRHQQMMTYSMQGQFSLDNESFDVSLALEYRMSFESTSTQHLTAQALKDPLVIQYGQQVMGSATNKVSFDFDADGNNDSLPMFSGDIGYLVYDKNQNNIADDGTELFGPQTNHGFNELSELDENKDGFISASDAHFNDLYLWQENKGNRVWMSLSEAGIKGIHLDSVYTHYDIYDESMNKQAEIRRTSFAVTNDGNAKPVHLIDVNV